MAWDIGPAQAGSWDIGPAQKSAGGGSPARNRFHASGWLLPFLPFFVLLVS